MSLYFFKQQETIRVLTIKNKNMKKIIINLPMYDMGLTVAFGSESELGNCFPKLSFKKKGCFIPKKNLICIVQRRGTLREDYISSVVHEVNHFVEHQAMRKGFMEEMEHKAYLSGYLVKEIYRGLFKSSSNKKEA